MSYLIISSAFPPNVLPCKYNWSLNSAKKDERLPFVVEELAERVINGIRIATVVQGAHLIEMNPVFATERPWKPRRHHRRLGEQHTERPFYNPLSNDNEKGRKKFASQETTVNKIRLQELHMKMKSPRRQYQRKTQEMVPRWISRTSQFVPVTGFSLIAIFILWKILQKVQNLLKNERPRSHRATRGAGRWIHDRSLGGKEIFVQHTNTGWNPLGDEIDRSLDSTNKEYAQMEPVPHWWCPPLTLYVSNDMKSEARSQARKIMRQLEDSRFSAKDYSLDLILQLYRSCVDACIVMKPSSNSIARSLYSYAVKQTILLISEGIGGPGGILPYEFMSRLSYVLNLHTGEAVKIVHNETTAKMRSLVLQIFADVRGTGHSTYSLRSFARLLSELPIPETHAELIGSSITSTTTEHERIDMYDLLAQTSPDSTHLVGKLLGKVEFS